MRAAGYIRVSSESQVDGFSLETQRAAIAAFALARGWEVVFYEDAGVSAWSDETGSRPAFSRLMADAESRSIDVVLVYKVDRFARSIEASMRELRRLHGWGVTFASVTEPTLDYTTSQGRMMLGVLSLFAQHFSDQLSERTSAGIRTKQARLGRNAHGQAPFGARRVDGRLELDAELVPALRLLLEESARGSDYSAAAVLNAAGYRPRRGDAWLPDMTRRVVIAGEWLLSQPSPWPALWLAARDRPRRPRLAAAAPVSLLSGLLRCACGGWLVYHRKQTRGKWYLGFACRRHDRERTKGSGCPFNYRRRALAAVEAIVEAWFLALPDLASAVEADGAKPGIRRAELAEQREMLGERYQARAIDRARFWREIAAIDAAERALDAGAGRRATVLGTELAATQADWWAGILDTTAKNAALRLVIERVIVGEGVEIIPQPWLPVTPFHG